MNLLSKIHEISMESSLKAVLVAASGDHECPKCQQLCKQQLMTDCDGVFARAAQEVSGAWGGAFAIARHLIPSSFKIGLQVAINFCEKESKRQYVMCSNCSYIWLF